MKKVLMLCAGQGYDILTYSGESFPVAVLTSNSSSNASLSGNAYNYSGAASSRSSGFGWGGYAVTRSMQVRCKNQNVSQYNYAQPAQASAGNTGEAVNQKLPGVYIEKVSPGSDLEKHGFKSGDYIMSVNGIPQYGKGNIDDIKQGEDNVFKVYRDGKMIDLVVYISIKKIR